MRKKQFYVLGSEYQQKNKKQTSFQNFAKMCKRFTAKTSVKVLRNFILSLL